MQFLLFHAILLAPAVLAAPAVPYPLPWQAAQAPPPPQSQEQAVVEPLTAYDILLPIVNERIQKPKQWVTDPAAEGEIDVSDEDLEFLTPKSNVQFSNDASLQEWLSPLGKNFKNFMDTMKAQNEQSRADAEEAAEAEAEAEDSENLEKRAIPSMFNKGKKPQPVPEPEPEPTPEQQQAEEEIDNLEISEVEITNEEFDQLFKDYASRYERATSFQGLQGHLDTILLPGNIGYNSENKPWKQQPAGPRLARRGGRSGSSGATPSYLWTPESEKIGVKPVSSINPEIFNRIAAEYRFGQDPTSINHEEGVGGKGAGAAGAVEGQEGQGAKKGKKVGM